MNAIIQAIRSDRIARGALTLVSGTAAGRAVGLLTVPLLARIYSPADYGLAAVVMAIIAVVLPFATLRYVVAVPLPRSDQVAAAVMQLCALLIMCVSGLVGVVLVAAALLGQDNVLGVPSHYYWAIPVGLAVAGAYELAMLWGTRIKAYARISRSQVFQSVAGEGVKIGLGVLGFRPIGLVLGQIVAQGSGGLLILSRERARILAAIRRAPPRRMLRVARLYVGFPTYRLPSHVLLQLSVQAPLLIVAYLYQSASAGTFAMVAMLIALPATIVGQAIGTSFYGEIAAIGRRDPNKVRALTIQTQKRILVFALPMGLVALAVGDHLTLILGQEWEQASQFFIVMIPMAVAQILSTPVVQVLNVINRQHLFLRINILRILLIILMYFSAHVLNLTVYHFVVAYSIIMTGFYLALCALVPTVLYRHRRIPV